ncbi:MAG: pre-peptidase C-terminal domain-containing protein [Chloroflexota bacterium]
MQRFFVFLSMIIFSGLITAAAQADNLTPYSWDDANLALAYPADWDTPIASNPDGRLVLQLAQTLNDQPDTRPPGIPFINLSLLPNDIPDVDLTPYIAENFNGIGITPVGSTASTLIGFDALTAEGSSSDKLLFGLMRAVELPDNQILLVTGRAVEAQHEAFTQLFNDVVDSIVLGAESEPTVPTYGVLWNTGSTTADGESAFVDVSSITYSPNGKVYAVDSSVGVLELDAQTGAVIATYPNDQITLPSAIAVGSDDTVYVADSACQCIQVLGADKTWGDPIDGFGIESPASLVTTADGSLYATNQTDAGVEVQVIKGKDRQKIELGVEVNVQPLLAVSPSGQVLALTDDGNIYPIEEGDYSALYTLNMPSAYVNGFAVAGDNQFVLATSDRGVLIVDSTGSPINGLGKIVANYPMPGEFVSPHGVAMSNDGTIYITDSDGTFGAVTAMNTRVAAGRVGSTVLIPGAAVQGTLNSTTTQQDWVLNGEAGQTVTISAVDVSESGALDVGLKLIAPNGQEEANNDDQTGTDLTTAVDSQISDYILAASGKYTVRVELVNGSGTYRLGIVQELPFTLSGDAPTQLQGTLEGALPKQRWIFDAKAGQVLTITMQAQTGTLDPVLRLLDKNGNVVADNDDAADTALGKDAQIVMVKIPANGTYTLEAGRFSGAGDYSLVIVATS